MLQWSVCFGRAGWWAPRLDRTMVLGRTIVRSRGWGG